MRIASLILLLVAFPTPALPKDKRAEEAQALIRKATELSDVSSMGPLTLRMSVKFYAVKSGTIDAKYEKIVSSPQQWRATFSSPEYNSVILYADSQVSEWSDAQEKPVRVRQFERALAGLSQSVVGEGLEYTRRERKVEGESDRKLPCIQVKDRRREVQDCFDPNDGTFKLVQDGDWTFGYEGYKRFGSKLYPGTIVVFAGFRMVAVAKVEQLERSLSPAPKPFDPPANAEIYPACLEGLGLPLGAKGGKVVKQPWPQSPGLPPNSGIISNDAVVYAILGRDGRLHNIRVSENIPFLRDATYEAVRGWEYEPFKVCGHPVEMPIGFTIWFGKGGGVIGTSEHD